MCKGKELRKGDRVVISSHYNYAYTKLGSEGVVVDPGKAPFKWDDRTYIEFYKLTGDSCVIPFRFYIPPDHLKLAPPFKVGDKVVVHKKGEYQWNQQGGMDMWVGRTLTIDYTYKVSGAPNDTKYSVKENSWSWAEDCLKPVEKIKVGDTVEILDTHPTSAHYSKRSERIGKTAKVAELHPVLGIKLPWVTAGLSPLGLGGDYYFIRGVWLGRLGEKEVKKMDVKLEVGDQVEVIDRAGSGKAQLGEVGTVKEITYRPSPSKYLVNIQVFVAGGTVKEYSMYSRRFKKLAELGVGDTVCVVAQTHAWGCVKKGETGIVDSVKASCLFVDFPSYKHWQGTRKCFLLVKRGRGGEIEMSRVAEVRKAIKKLENGWDEAADKLIKEMRCGKGLAILIQHYSQTITVYGKAVGSQKETFHYTDTCDKMDAFVEALLWILDYCPLKDKRDKVAEKKADKKAELRRKLEALEGELMELEGE